MCAPAKIDDSRTHECQDTHVLISLRLFAYVTIIIMYVTYVKFYLMNIVFKCALNYQ